MKPYYDIFKILSELQNNNTRDKKSYFLEINLIQPFHVRAVLNEMIVARVIPHQMLGQIVQRVEVVFCFSHLMVT